MNELEQLQSLKDRVSVGLGLALESVETGIVPHDKVGLGGPQQFLTLRFHGGQSVRIETRSGFEDEGGFFVVR